ncbi:hypothetical protein ACTXLJ_05640 [Psychrobacter celer]|uniref:hypothetical protein n=1 Tax=Psychrobacter celer TaxID=306572 RepID=UPI003FD3C6CC
MSNLQPLPWKDLSQGEVRCVRADSPIYDYAIVNDGKAFKVGYYNPQSPIKYATGFATIDDAKTWCWNHYNEKMQPYVNADSITDIANWFKAAKPEPTIDDLCVQIGCHLEEVAELLEALGLKDYDTHEQLTIDADHFKNKSKWALMKLTKLNYEQHIAIVDACCDINVTSVGVMQLLGGVDVLGAQREVIRSNNSKMVKGKFQYDENGKIAKPESYSKPDLTPFVKQGE